MDEQRSALWRRICDFQLDDPGASFTFTDRLATENGWSRQFARRVVEEYKRFAFLAVAAGHEVTPSDEVDQVWHLHLTYTRSYWDEFCPHVLGRPLHQGPTKGGPTEASRYREQYERTLESYETLFHERPPTDIWPPAELRFSRSISFCRVSTNRYWLVDKRLVHRAALLVGIGCLGFVAAGAGPPIVHAGFLKEIGALLFFVGMIAAVLFGIFAAGAAKGRRGRGGGDGGFIGFWGIGGGDRDHGGSSWFGGDWFCGGGGDGGGDGGGGCGGGCGGGD